MKTYYKDNKDAIRAHLDRPIVLIGLMGAGKSRIGRMLAEALDLPFCDSDDEVEKAAGMSIPDIFECYGESAFRDGEKKVIRRLIEDGIQVIATGGGAIMSSETAALIKDRALSVWIRADIPVILERTARTDKRPLLRVDNPEAVLRALAEKRYPVYAKADITVDSGNGEAEDVLNRALKGLADYLSRAEAERSKDEH
ncbi:MAG: shikimate kinase [Alphaproteobacteria bacterium]|nr:shikimate kinase [Alphaproteobacteria bacterium]